MICDSSAPLFPSNAARERAALSSLIAPSRLSISPRILRSVFLFSAICSLTRDSSSRAVLALASAAARCDSIPPPWLSRRLRAVKGDLSDFNRTRARLPLVHFIDRIGKPQTTGHHGHDSRERRTGAGFFLLRNVL